MNVKESVLKSLERGRGNFISGEELAKLAHVSRQSVCKAVKSLRADGHIITSSTKKGYLLENASDVISAPVIEEKTGVRTYVYGCVSSTNTVAAEKFLEGGECLVIALAQTGGRKKDGGNFYSPEDKGIYLSLALPLEISLDKLKDAREKCGGAVAEVISKSCKKTARAVNLDDVYIGGKKACGILIECAVNAALRLTRSAVIGIGVYTSEKCFEDTSLCSVFPNESRNEMIAQICLQVKNALENL